MPIVKSRIRNSSQNVLCTSILIVFSLFAAVVLYINRKIYTEIIDFTEPTTLFLLCFGVVTIIVLTSLFNLVLQFHFENFLSGQSSNILNKLKNHLKNHENLCFIIYLDIALCCVLFWLYLSMDFEFNWSYLLIISSASILFACLTVWSDYDDVDLSLCQNMENSIGASWAHGAYKAFYQKILKDITRRMCEFEDQNRIKLLVMKLIIICPLSCNANGSLDNKDGNIKALLNTLEEITDDEGANYNRILKTNVYKIEGQFPTYIAAEIPSPLATLYEMRDAMDPVILEYHRECFIETLKDLLKSEPCEILKYDDLTDYPEPLHMFLLSKLDKKFVNVIK